MGKEEKKRKLQIEDWVQRYQLIQRNYNEEQNSILEKYRPAMRKGIAWAISHGNLSEYEFLETVTECFEYELMIKFSKYIVTKNPPMQAVCKIALKCAAKRKFTWYADMIRLKDACRIENGKYDCGFEGYEQDMVPVMGKQQYQNHLGNIPGPSNANPVDAILAKERASIIQLFPDYLRGSKKKRASEYFKIYKLQMNGVEVGKEHSSILDIPEKKIASYKHQMVDVLREFLCGYDTEVKKQLQIFKKQKGMKWPIKKSTVRERNALYRAETVTEDMLPSEVRIIDVKSG